MDLLVPVLERDPTETAIQKWVDMAHRCTRDELRERVQEDLGRPVRGAGEPGARFEQMVGRAMPNAETRTLAEDFFRIGKEHVGSENTVDVMIAAMKECVETWTAHPAW